MAVVDAQAADVVRARIGLVVPSVNTVLEEWFPGVLPRGVPMHVSRVPIAPAATTSSVEEMARHEEDAIRLVADCKPDIIIHACVAASAWRGPVRDKAFAAEMSERVGVRVCTAMETILMALEKLEARRICIASPYVAAIDALERRFFEESGIEVTGGDSLEITDTRKIAMRPARDILELGRRAWVPGSDALLVSCLALRSHAVIDQLEQQLDTPVVTATQAALWAALRTCGIRDAIGGYGRLLA